MRRRLTIGISVLMFIAQNIFATDYYVSLTGSDSNQGTTSGSAFATLGKALASSKAGDVILVSSGTYAMGTTPVSIIISNLTIKGVFKTAAGRPVFDFSKMPVASTNIGIQLKGSNCSFYGFVIKGAGDNGLLINGGSYNIVEFCDFLENQDSGVQIKGNGGHNKFINCDSYFNVDVAQGNADGFANKLDAGGYNSFRGCRAYQNSDDGWDGLLGDVNYTPNDTIIDSWCYKNGYLKSGAASNGNGNGFKLGGSQGSAVNGPFIHRQTLIRCLSVKNLQKGFDYNNNVGSMTLYNCTGYGNGGTGNFAFPNSVATGEKVTLKNCLSYDTKYGSLYSGTVQATNSWSGGVSVSSADFQSIDDAQMLLPRKNDGSLPDITFLHLASGSDLINAGTNVGLPYVGSSPDLGCFEYGSVLGGVHEENFNNGISVVFPNPTQGIVHYKTTSESSIKISIINSLGETLTEKALSAGEKEATFLLEDLNPGFYILQEQAAGKIIQHKILVKR